MLTRRWPPIAVSLLVAASLTLAATAGSAKPPAAAAAPSAPVAPAPGPSCELMPIALAERILDGVAPGTELRDVANGAGPGSFGWLTWTGDNGVPALVAALTPPGTSGSYVDPDDPADRRVSPGDRVRGRPGVASSKQVRDALDALNQVDIAVPTWDVAAGSGASATYRVAGFALLRLLDYRLPGENRISARFLGRRDCSPPAGDRIEAETDEDMPVTVTISATDADSSQLEFAVTQPAHGTAGAPTPPQCTTAAGTTTCTSTVRYTPAANFNGADSFTYVARDGALDSRAVGVRITVRPVADPPVASDLTVATDEDTPAAVVLAASDPDGDPLAYAIVDGPRHGTLDPAGPGGATRTYRPDANFAGTDSFTYRASDASAGSNTATVTVGVRPRPDAPQITSVPVTRVGAGEAYAYDVDVSDADAGDVHRFSLPAHPAGMTVDPVSGAISWVASGATAAVTVRVEDRDGLADTQSFTITVDPGPRPPVAVDDAPAGLGAREDTALAIPAAALLANDSDPDGDALTIAAVVATADTHGSVQLDGADVVYMPDPDHNGPVAFAYRASDGSLQSGSAVVRFAIAPVNDAPAAVDDTASTAAETFTIPAAGLTANDSPGPANETGQSLVVTAVGPLPGTAGTVSMFLGDVVYTPPPGYSGTDSFAYTACDDGTTAGAPDPRCGAATVTVEVTATPRPPVAEDLTLVTDEDVPAALVLRASDPDGDPLTFEIVDGPDKGSLTPAGSGPAARTYTPDPDANGVDRLTYRASDRALSSNTATVTIDVRERNDVPVAVADAKRVDGRALSFPAADLAANDSAGPANESSQALNVTRVIPSATTRGDVTLVLGTIAYTAEAGFNGEATFGYEVCDDGTSAGAPDPRCATGEVTLTVTQAPVGPVAVDLAVTTDEDEPVAVTLSATDPSGDPLTYAIVAGPAAGAVFPPGPGGAERTYTPDANVNGPDVLTYRASDGTADSNTATVTVTVRPVNDPPAAATDDRRATRDIPLTFPAAALASNDSPGPANEAAQTLAVAAVTAGPDTHGSVVLAGGDVTYTPAAGFLGDADFGYRVCDDGETAGDPDPRCADGAVRVTVAEASLQSIAVTPASRTIAGGESVQYTATGTFTDGSTRDVTGDVAWTSSAPAVANVTPGAAARGGEPGTTTITASMDGASQTASLTVTAAELRSIVVEPQDPTILTGDTRAFQATGVLSDGTSRSLAGQVAWMSATPSVASIAPDGTASAAAEGTTVVSATSDGVTGTSTLTVRARIADPTPPTAQITAPANNAELTGPADVVGTASDPNFLKYVLELAPAGESTFTTIEEGTSPVTAGVLGQFDPTQLRNDLYTVRLTVFDRGGNTSIATRTWQVARDQKVGNFSIAFQDLDIPLSGIPITINRVYDSRDKGVGDFGVGWRIDIQTLRIRANRVQGTGWQVTRSGGLFPTYTLVPTDAHKVSVSLPDGRVEEFDLVPAPSSSVLLPLEFISATYRARPGTLGTLRPIANPGMFVNGAQPGEVELLDDGDLDVYDPQVFEYTSAGGAVYVIDKRAGVQSVRDRNGNTLTIGPSGITHSSGVGIAFVRDARGRITTITDPAGNQHRYAYDANGDLASYLEPAGNRTTFAYNRSHGLIEIRDPRGIQVARNEYDDDGRLVAIVDADGRRTTYEHDLAGRQEIIRDRRGRTTVLDYDGDGNVLRKTDPLGGVTARTYDARGNTLTVTDPLGNTTTTVYDARDNVIKRTDATGAEATFTHNALGQVLTERDGNGNVTTNTYDARGNLRTTTDPEGGVTTHGYDADGNPLVSTDAAGNAFRYAYDGAGRLVTHTDAAGVVTAYVNDANGNRVRTTTTRTRADGTVATIVERGVFDGANRLVESVDGLGNTARTEYDDGGRVAATVDERGGRTSHDYDALGRLSRTTFPDGTSESYAYDANGMRTAMADRAGRTTRYAYDALDRLATTTFPDGATETTEYDATSRIAARVNARGNRTTFGYDAAGRRTRMTDPRGAVTTYAYDDAGRKLGETDPLGETTTFAYDDAGRLTRTTFPDGSFSTSAYDGAGRRIAATDETGAETQLRYDAIGRLSGVTDAIGGITSFGRDERGNLTAVTDARGNTTRFAYDDGGRMISRALPAGEVERFGYDAAGNLTSRTAFDGETTTRDYDAMGRPTREARPEGTVVRTYTATGAPATVEDRGALTTYDHDARDRPVRIVDPAGRAVEYGYDAAGERTTIASAAGTIAFAYDAAGNLATVTEPGGGETTHAYDLNGNRIATARPNGTRTTYDHDGRNRLDRVTHARADGTTISDHAYTLDAAGQRIEVAEDGGRTVRYDYDPLQRLVEEDVADPASGDRLTTYDYDAVGNRTAKTSGAGTTTYTYDADDRLRTAGGETLHYDADGNVVRREGEGEPRTYAYDSANRLVGTTFGGASTQLRYDADGNRVGVTSGAASRDYVVDTAAPLPQVLEERAGDGSLAARYTFGGESLVSRTAGGVTSYHHEDALGSTRALTDASGSVRARYAYDAFGNDAGSSGAATTDIRFAGEQLEPELGTYYLRARHLDPTTGRFMSLDPLLQGESEEPLSTHRYAYANGDPVNERDPTGLLVMTTGVLVSSQMQVTVRTTTTASAMLALRRAAFTVAKAVVQTCALSLWLSEVVDVGSANPCKVQRYPMLYPGRIDTPDTSQHIQDAIVSNPVWANLTRGTGNGPRQWYGNDPRCKGRSMTQWCDEYPFYKTMQGGAGSGASLRLVPEKEQRLQAGYLSAFYRVCGLVANDPFKGSYGVIPNAMPTTRYTCRDP